MKLAMMLEDILHSAFRRTATRQYPFERTETPEHLRGKLHWNPEQCTGCSLCVDDCPANAIELITLDKSKKQFEMRYHLDRCTFCGQCVESCRFKCIELSHDQWELATLDKTSFITVYGPAAHDASNVGKVAPPDSDTSSQS